jgi:uncharacterized RmlC-like cupin family protein
LIPPSTISGTRKSKTYRENTALNFQSDANSTNRVSAVRPTERAVTEQNVDYFFGVSGATVGAKKLSMHLVVIPPSAHAIPHVHVDHETAIYVLEGDVLTRWGTQLEHEVRSVTGEFLYIPPGVPHEAINLSSVAEARAIIARDSPLNHDTVRLYTPPSIGDL